jgi:hypothetical protein
MKIEDVPSYSTRVGSHSQLRQHFYQRESRRGFCPQGRRPDKITCGFILQDGFERTLVITTISSRGRRSSLMAFPKTISDSPLEYTYNKKSVKT